MEMCHIPVTGCMVKNPVTGEWELDEERSTWADIPADVIARKLIGEDVQPRTEVVVDYDGDKLFIDAEPECTVS